MAVLRYAAQEKANIDKAAKESRRISAVNASLAQRNAEAVAAAGYEPAISAGSAGQYWTGSKSWATLNKSAVGLGNVDNTADANKPVSTAQQTAIDGKLNTWVAAPASAASTGTAGQLAYDSSWLYVCVSSNTWVRTALATW